MVKLIYQCYILSVPNCTTPQVVLGKVKAMQCVDGLDPTVGSTGSGPVVLVSSLKERYEPSPLVSQASSTGMVLTLAVPLASVVGFLGLLLGFVFVRRAQAERRKLENAPRGLVALMFTDIQDSTRLWATFPEEFAEALEIHNNLMRASTAKYSGYEVRLCKLCFSRGAFLLRRDVYYQAKRDFN